MQCNKTLAFYIRLSAEDADLKSSGKAESNSVTNQRKLLRDYYEQHTELCEYEVVEFCDDGYTGTNFDRPQFMLMMEQIRRREIQAIMVKDLSRFGRDYLEVGAYLELILPLFGTRFISESYNSRKTKNMCPILTQAEGLITGMAAKMFLIAGPVIVFGTAASVVYGVVLWLLGG